MYFRASCFLDEHAWAEAKVQRWFIHEMANLWQSAHQC